MSAKSEKKAARPADRLTPAERREVKNYGAYADDAMLAKLNSAELREIERVTYGIDRDLSDHANRLQELAGVLATLVNHWRDQANHLSRELKKIEEENEYRHSAGRNSRRARKASRRW
jgi:RNA polymerase-binding transcription factor DksA